MNKAQKISLATLILLGIGFIYTGHYIQKQWLTPPNIVFILIDTVRADCIDPDKTPNPVTPFLSALAKESIYISNAITPCSWTKPTIATFLTGLPPEKHGVRFSVFNEDPNAPVSDTLRETFLTLPEYLSEHGYETFAVQTNANLVPLLGFAQGFKKENFYFEAGAIASTVTSKSLEFVSKSSQPFFLYAHYMDPHMPYIPPDNVLQTFEKPKGITEEELKRLEPDTFFEYGFHLVYYNLGKRTEPPKFDYSEAGKEEIKRRYKAEIRFTDTEVERLVRSVKKNFPNTIFFIVSDHGEEFWEHRGVGHGTTLYEEQVRVPVIIHGKGIQPQRIDADISTLGVAKTIIYLTGLPIPPQFEGSNLTKQNINEVCHLITWGPWSDMEIHLKAVVNHPWKLVVNKNNNVLQLFQLTEDPDEISDKSTEFPEVVKKIMQNITGQELNSYTNQENTMPLPPDIVQNLKALGYLE